MSIVCSKCFRNDVDDPSVSLVVGSGFVVCPRCKSEFTVVSREVVSLQSAYADGVRYRYVLSTVEDGGLVRLRRFSGHGGIVFRPGDMVSLVFQHGQLVGVADHGNDLWYPVDVPYKPNVVASVVMGFVLVFALLLVFDRGISVLSVVGLLVFVVVVMVAAVVTDVVVSRRVDVIDTGWSSDS